MWWDHENSNLPPPDREAPGSLLHYLGCKWLNKFSQCCPTLECWSEEEQTFLAQCSLPIFTLFIFFYHVLPLHLWIYHTLCLCALGLYPSVTQAQFRLVQRIFPYQENMGRRNAGQIQALMSGNNPCFHSCVSAHAITMRKALPVLPTSPWRKRWYMTQNYT